MRGAADEFRVKPVRCERIFQVHKSLKSVGVRKDIDNEMKEKARLTPWQLLKGGIL
jgi:hypothetical protein